MSEIIQSVQEDPSPSPPRGVEPLPGAGDAELVRLQAVTKRYRLPAGDFTALDAVSLGFARRGLVAITGPSGSGKSTLLNLIAGLDQATSGEVVVGGKALRALAESELARFRGAEVGVVFQFFQLLPTLTAFENILLAMELVGRIPHRERTKRARALLARVGVGEQAHKFPATLSGGQQQRVAIARALANDPPLLVADEPTGNLDSETAASVVALLKELAREGKAVLVVTHDPRLARACDRVVELRDGRVVAKLGPVTAGVAPCGGEPC